MRPVVRASALGIALLAACANPATRSVTLRPMSAAHVDASPWFDSQQCVVKSAAPIAPVAGVTRDVTIAFTNEMSSAYSVRSIAVVIDGMLVAEENAAAGVDEVDPKALGRRTVALAPGDHQIATFVAMRPHSYCVYCYLRAYCFEVSSARTLFVGEDPISIKIRLFEKGSVTTPIDERPAIEYVPR